MIFFVGVIDIILVLILIKIIAPLQKI